MDFSLNQIYELDSKCQKELRSVLKLSKSSSLSCISEENIRKADKEDLSNVILSLVDVTESSVNILRSAAVSMEQLSSEKVINQRKIIKLQNKLIQKQETLSSVGTESGSSNQQVMKNDIKSAIKSVVQENERQQEIMLFGVSEDTSDLGETVKDIVRCVGAPAYRQLRPKESISHGLTGYPINGTTDWFEHKVETTVAPLPSTGDFKLSISA